MTLPLAAIEDVVFDVVDALRVPVLVLALLALAVVIVELGSLGAELARRRRRDPVRLERAAVAARAAAAEGKGDAAALQLREASSSAAMDEVLTAMLAALGTPGEERRIAKRLADFDLRSLKRLERTRLLVRAGPALGLMGTLIPLSPALVALANGNIDTLTQNLRVAFSITVVGLLVGAVAFGISLIRDRLYAQDFSDLEFVAATLTAPEEVAA
jgi:biopolymer transport protein ExbB/TolQ